MSCRRKPVKERRRGPVQSLRSRLVEYVRAVSRLPSLAGYMWLEQAGGYVRWWYEHAGEHE